MTHSQVCEIVSKVMNLDYREIYVRTRKSDVVLGRKLAMYILANDYGYSEPNIGRIFNLDHSTVHHHKKQVKGFLDVGDIRINILLEQIRYFLRELGDEHIDLKLRRSELCFLVETIDDNDIKKKLRKFLVT